MVMVMVTSGVPECGRQLQQPSTPPHLPGRAERASEQSRSDVNWGWCRFPYDTALIKIKTSCAELSGVDFCGTKESADVGGGGN